jgi:Fe-S cluster assembly iron-binding protein IscA
LTLDESTENDQIMEQKGITFLLDSFAVAYIENGLTIDYDEYEDNFIVQIKGIKDSCC